MKKNFLIGIMLSFIFIGCGTSSEVNKSNYEQSDLLLKILDINETKEGV